VVSQKTGFHGKENTIITAGVDIGIENVKVVILKDGKILVSKQAPSGGSNRAGSAEKVWEEALKEAGISASDVGNVIATGQGKWDVHFAKDYIVEPVANARAAVWMYPSARSVLDIGSDQARAVNFDTNGAVTGVVLNQKCSAGFGMFFRSLARMLGMTIDEMSLLSGNSQNSVSVNERCNVFAEMDTHWLVHNNTPKQDIVQARNEAAAIKLNSLLNEKITLEKDTVLIGGVARNAGVINALKKRSGIDFLIPAQPEFGSALGAALIAAA
jgi:predicted CoA-substrate-specific enzyme activase